MPRLVRLGRGILTTPRDITRLANALAVTWPAILDHVELFDFIGIETLRIVEPDVWELLRDRRRELVGEVDIGYGSGTKVPKTDELIGNDAPLAVKRLIGRLFPLTVGGRPSSNRRAISSPEAVDIYFQFQPGIVPGRSVLDQMLLGADRAELARRLRAIGERRQLRSLLSDLTDRLTDLDISPAQVFAAVCDAGDALISRPFDAPPSLHDIEVFRDIDELLRKALQSVPPNERGGLISDVVRSSPSISMPVEFGSGSRSGADFAAIRRAHLRRWCLPIPLTF